MPQKRDWCDVAVCCYKVKYLHDYLERQKKPKTLSTALFKKYLRQMLILQIKNPRGSDNYLVALAQTFLPLQTSALPFLFSVSPTISCTGIIPLSSCGKICIVVKYLPEFIVSSYKAQRLFNAAVKN